MGNATKVTWRDVRNHVYNQIQTSVYSPGQKLPSDQEMATYMGCSRTTVQRAMQDLFAKGTVDRKRKGGTRVRSDPPTRATFEIPITKQEIESKGHAYKYDLISSAIEAPPESVLKNFHNVSSQKMLHIESLHYADKKAYIYEDRWVATDTVPEILEADLEMISANEWLVRNKPYTRCDIRFYSISAGDVYSEIFNTLPSEPLFVIERTTWSDDKLITTLKAVAHPGYEIVTSIRKK